MSECPFILLLPYYKNDQCRIKVIYMYRMDGFTSLNKFLYEMKINTSPLIYHKRIDSLNVKNDEQGSMGKILNHSLILKRLYNTIC